MKALTIGQPWAWAIIKGLKRIENRTWRTRHRGPLLIHAAASLRWWRDMDVLPDGTPVPALDSLAFSAFLGVVDVVDCLPIAEAPAGPFAVGPYCWILENPRAFAEPIAGKGTQMLWNAPESVAELAVVL